MAMITFSDCFVCRIKEYLFNMGRRNSFILCAIGVLVFTSVVQAQEPRGTPGVDYPNYFTIPETSFKCSDQKYNPGFYADLETKCQAFHFCYQDRMESFLCPTGTIFNQAVLTCDVWYKSNCSLAEMFYSVNAGPIMERAGKNLPMLLRLRNRSQTKSPVPTLANVDDKVSYESENETPEVSSISKGKELKTETTAKSNENSIKEFNKNDQMLDSHGEFASEDESEETDKFTHEVDEEMDTNLVYGNINDGYYKNYDQYDGEWQDAEQESRSFKDFYYGEPYDYKIDAKYQSNNYINKESLEDSDFQTSDSLYEDFTKRSSQNSRTRVRRKPIYVLDDQPAITAEEMAETRNLESDIFNNDQRKGKEMNLTSDSVEAETPSPTPFPRPTAMPRNLLNISTATPMSSEDFEEAIISEIAYPTTPSEEMEEAVEIRTPDGNVLYVGRSMEASERARVAAEHAARLAEQAAEQAAEHAARLAEQAAAQAASQSDNVAQSGQTYDSSPQNDAIYIENDVEPDNYVSYDSEYEDVIVVPESGEEPARDAEDTFVVIPDEYDNVADFEVPDYSEEVGFRTQILADESPAAGYDEYNSYRYSSNVDYPGYYEQAVYPEHIAQMHENYMPNERYAYENSYEIPSQSLNYQSSDFDSESYAQTESYPYAETRLGVTETPIALPVTEADLDNFEKDFSEVVNPEQDMIELENEPGQPDDVYYVLDFDEQSNQENETAMNKEEKTFDESLDEKSESVHENPGVNELKSPNNSSVNNESSDNESKRPEEFTKTDESAWSSNSLSSSQSEHIEPDNVKSDMNKNSKNTLAGSNLKHASQIPLARESLASTNTPFSSNIGSLDFSSDSRFLNNMGYSESMDFGPYGFGPNMGQQFSMMESMQSQATNPFSQRISPAEQPKLSPLSAIQEKMRSMKQGKFGAFKKYMSSASN